jgi:nucleotide-binding universal stress UspA family protein
VTGAPRTLAPDSPLETIVVGYDGTRPAERALVRAAQLARAFGARVVVADVAPPEPLQGTPGAFGFMPYSSYTAERRVRTDEELWRQHRGRIETFFAETGVMHEFAGLVGQPVKEIVEVAERCDADLIVVGTRELGFLERLLEGSVSQGVARRAHRDVLIVHPPEGTDEPEQA